MINRSEQVSIAVHVLVVSAMMGCMVTTLVQIGEAVIPGWDGTYLVVYSFLVAMEAMYSQRAAQKLIFPNSDWFLYRGTEWVVLTAMLKLAFYFEYGFNRFLTDLSLWQQDFWAFFDSEYLFAIMVVALVWVLSSRFSGELRALEADEQALRIEQETGVYEQREMVRSGLVDMVLSIGIVMIVLTSMLRVEALMEWIRLAPLRAGVYNVLLYFLLGLVLLSMTQFNMMRSRWILEHISVEKEIAVRWFFYGLIFIAAVAIVASLLPTQYSVGLLGALNFLVTVLVGALNFLIWLLLLPVLLLFNLLMHLLGQSEASVPIEGVRPLQQMAAPQETTSIPWLDMLRSLLFWTIFLGAIGFSLYYYLRERDDVLRVLKRLRISEGLARFWTWLSRLWKGVNRQIGVAVDSGWQRLRARLGRKRMEQAWQFINLRRLSPRQRVLFYYLAMVRRGEEMGLSRKPGQTPYEYSQKLVENLGAPQEQQSLSDVVAAPGEEAVQAVSGITERFVEARYSLHEVDEQQASLVKRYWERIRRALRSVFRSGDQG
ncbi:MAG: DUF4129 domain-containing protein [Chloroflexota bacterium]